MSTNAEQAPTPANVGRRPSGPIPGRRPGCRSPSNCRRAPSTGWGLSNAHPHRRRQGPGLSEDDGLPAQTLYLNVTAVTRFQIREPPG
jgi:hypothetical protein